MITKFLYNEYRKKLECYAYKNIFTCILGFHFYYNFCMCEKIEIDKSKSIFRDYCLGILRNKKDRWREV